MTVPVSASQASVLLGAVPSLAITGAMATAGTTSNVCGPKLDAPSPSGNVSAAPVGVSVRLGKPFHTYICMRGGVPSLKVLMLALLPCPLSALSCASAVDGVVAHAAAAEVVALRVLGRLVEARVVPVVVQPVGRVEDLRNRRFDLVHADVGRLRGVVDAIELSAAR